MSSTSFTNGVTLTDDDWFNDVNRLHYTIFGDPANTASAAAAIALDFGNVRVGGTLSVSAAAVFTGALAAGDFSASAVAGLAVATQAQQEAASATNKIVTPGRQQYHPSAAKVWVSFNGAATSVTAASAFNVTSITDNGTGDYIVNFTTPFSSNNYCVLGTPFNNTSANNVVEPRSVSAANVSVVCVNWAQTQVDLVYAALACFGDQ